MNKHEEDVRSLLSVYQQTYGPPIRRRIKSKSFSLVGVKNFTKVLSLLRLFLKLKAYKTQPHLAT